MSSAFERAFLDLAGNEGGYVCDPRDPGGETNWGVTVAIARECGYQGEMRAMDRVVARGIYRQRFWLPQFEEMPYALAFQVFDSAVNSGIEQAVRWLQRALGVADDGRLGPLTLQAVKAADPLKLVALYNAERLEFYTRLSTWNAFGRGWTRRVAGNLRKAAAE